MSNFPNKFTVFMFLGGLSRFFFGGGGSFEISVGGILCICHRNHIFSAIRLFQLVCVIPIYTPTLFSLGVVLESVGTEISRGNFYHTRPNPS